MQVIKRNGSLVEFDSTKIHKAVLSAFRAAYPNIHGNPDEKHNVEYTVAMAVSRIANGTPEQVHVERVQDIVVDVLMEEFPNIGRKYNNYRRERAKQRVVELDESLRTIKNYVRRLADRCCFGTPHVSATRVEEVILRELYVGIPEDKVPDVCILATRTLIEEQPEYSKVAARMLLDKLKGEVIKETGDAFDLSASIQTGVYLDILSPGLLNFDLGFLNTSINSCRDDLFDYLGLQTLYDRYFIINRKTNRRTETPQVFFMRVAMGLAINENDKNTRAVEFYNLISSFDFMPSTPTLFNSGTVRPQLSSCYVSTIPDDLGGIFESTKENSLLSKYAGGLGNDWTPVRAMGSRIKGTNGESQGVVPFLKVVNDAVVAVNQGGKRKGALCSYLETWHLDIEEFLELRKNTGDDRRRTHDMNTANWIPDLFMERVIEEGTWTLFSPSDVPDLHDLYGIPFKEAYERYETEADKGNIRHKRLEAVTLWRKMLSMLFETGHPWITFKDAFNLRNPQKHVGGIHSSNLCTEIALNTSAEETAVCNLGSVNLVNHIDYENGGAQLAFMKLKQTIRTAMRMLDNVIDINYYPSEKARTSNTRHRPVGIGYMGFQDYLYALKIPYSSGEAVEISNNLTELFCHNAYLASCGLARERGAYSTFGGSSWHRGEMPQDSIGVLAQNRVHAKGYFNFDEERSYWGTLRKLVGKYGMRNSLCVAIAPTATIANIVGVTASIEPTFLNLFTKSNLSGEFTVVNKYLVNDLRKEGLWDLEMLKELKKNNGSLYCAVAYDIPNYLKELYVTAFDIDPCHMVKCGAARQVWIDQAQSLNIYLSEPSGKKLDEIYKLAWSMGLKSTYYLRTMSASDAEKSTGDGGELTSVLCSIVSGEECESCQ